MVSLPLGVTSAPHMTIEMINRRGRASKLISRDGNLYLLCRLVPLWWAFRRYGRRGVGNDVRCRRATEDCCGQLARRVDWAKFPFYHLPPISLRRRLRALCNNTISTTPHTKTILHVMVFSGRPSRACHACRLKRLKVRKI